MRKATTAIKAGFFGMMLAAALAATAQTNSAPQTNAATAKPQLAGAALVEKLRSDCIQGRRSVCGRIVKVLSDGLVIESGYPSLQRLPLSRSWLISGTVVAQKDSTLVESKEPGTICVGLVYLTDFPKSKRLKPKAYDYVVIEGFPAGDYTYTSVGTVRRTVRHFSARLEVAVKINWDIATGTAKN